MCAGKEMCLKTLPKNCLRRNLRSQKSAYLALDLDQEQGGKRFYKQLLEFLCLHCLLNLDWVFSSLQQKQLELFSSLFECIYSFYVEILILFYFSFFFLP